MTRQSTVKLFKAVSLVGIYGGLLMPLTFIPVVIFPFVFSKLIPFQILLELTFPAYLALAWMEPRFRPPKSALYTAIIAYFGAILLSVIFSVDPSRSWWGNQERMNGLFTVLHFFLWLTMAIGVLKTWEQWRRLLGYEIVLSVVMGVVALLQKPFPNLLLFPAQERVGGLLDNPIYMGAYQIFNLAFIVLLFIKTRSTTLRWLLGVAALVDIAAFFAAQSRGALVGLAAMIGVFAVTYAIFTTNKKAKFGVLGAAGAGFFGYVIVFLLRATPFVANNAILNRLTNLTVATATRFIAWDIAWKGFLERPLTGWGFDCFHILFNAKYNPRSFEFGYYETWFDRAHNTVMDVLSMSGIFGFITYFGIFAALFFLVWRAYKKGWIDLPIMAILTALPIGYFIQNVFVFDHPAAFSMSYLMYAFVIVATRPGFLAPVQNGTPNGPAPLPAGPPAAALNGAGAAKSAVPRSAPWTAFVIIQIVGVFFAWRFSVLPFQASYLSIKANNLLHAGKAEEGFALFKQAGAIPTPYTDEQSFLLSRDIVEIVQAGQLANMPNWQEFYAFAKEMNERTNSEHPLNTNNLFVYAQLLRSVTPSLPQADQAAEVAKSEEYYKKALATSPTRQQVAFGLAQLESELGRGQEAYDILKKTTTDDPDIGECWWYLGGTAWFQLGKTDEGSADMVKAVKTKVPFSLRNVRDAAQLAQAALIQKDNDALKTILPQLPTLGGGSVDLYLSIAKAYETAGLTGERNSILNALIQVDPTIAPQLDALRNGKVNTIDESMKIAAANVASSTLSDAGTSSTSPTLIATSSAADAPPAAVPVKTGNAVSPRR
jgi:O-antigen ligase/tetratricopeptide (TPR) repeat protein